MGNEIKNNLPIDFWGIGVQKCGTTWLYSNLKKLPEFDLLPIKELHYFDRNPKYLSTNKLSEPSLVKRLINPRWVGNVIKNILSSIQRRDTEKLKIYRKWYLSNYNDDWYVSLFDGCKGYKGEVCSSYTLLEEEEILSMYRMSPKAKLILLLRNPVDRDWSTYRFNTRKNAKFSGKNATDDEIIEYMDTDGVALMSDYSRAIDNYTKVFPKEQILICFYDAIVENPEQLLRDIVNFISGHSNIKLDQLSLRKKVNQSKSISCPEKIRKHLEKKHYAQIKQLANTYGGYFNKWYEETYDERSEGTNKMLLPTIRV